MNILIVLMTSSRVYTLFIITINMCFYSNITLLLTKILKQKVQERRGVGRWNERLEREKVLFPVCIFYADCDIYCSEFCSKENA